MITEEEARKKWCVNAPPYKSVGYFCVASECMAWEWGPHVTPTERMGSDVEVTTNEDGSFTRRVFKPLESQEDADKRREGDCGLKRKGS